MSEIERLLAELCPDGVEYRALGSLGRRNTGVSITAAEMRSLDMNGGPIRIFAGGQTTADVAEEAVDAKVVIRVPSIIVKSRGHIDFSYYEGPFAHKAELWSYSINNSAIDQKFIYHFLKTKVGQLRKTARANSVKLPQLTVRETDGLRVPVPPLAVQRAIVKVLDTMETLEAELEAELEARRRQYAYYRDTLLSFKEQGGLRWVKLSELLREPLVNGRSVADGAGYPVLRLTALRGPTVDTNQRKLGAWDRQEGVRFRIEAGDLLVVRGNGSRDLIARASMVQRTEEIAFPDTVIRVRPDLNRISQRFLFYAWESPATRLAIGRVAKMTSGVFKVSQSDLEGVRIPVPPPSEQQRIVEILDSFDALVNDLTSGLPAEIAARRKQYEYYRDRLLSFEELAS